MCVCVCLKMFPNIYNSVLPEEKQKKAMPESPLFPPNSFSSKAQSTGSRQVNANKQKNSF